MKTRWTLTADLLPPQGHVVETKSEHGVVNDLKLVNGLWWIDGKTYVYYTPKFWRVKK